MAQERKHTTQDELNYINSIGQHSDHSSNTPRSELLVNYLAVSKKRSDWNNMDQKKCIAYAKKELALCTV